MDSASLDSKVHHAANSTMAVIEELEGMTLDPTLDQCCRRDLESQIRKERIRHALQREDRVDVRQRLAAAAVCKDPSAVSTAAAAAADRCNSNVDAAQDERPTASTGAQQFDADVELQHLRQQRLQQLKAQSAAKQGQQQEGFGTLNTVAESDVLRLCVRDPPGRGLVVLHLVVQGHEPCNALDECLSEAAAQYRGSYFARCVVSRHSPLVAELQLPRGLPALLVAKQGAVLGKAHITQFGGTDIWDEEVTAYLRRFKVLSTGEASSSCRRASQSATAIGGRHRDDSSDEGDSSSTDDEGTDWQAPCEVCGRTYPHEHIRSIYSSQQHDSDEED